MERFAKAIENILRRFEEKGYDVVDVYDIWIESSIPMDLIEEVIGKDMVNIPPSIEEIKVRGKNFWRRRN
ncbi:MAG: hypothetical protein J7L34_08030 [Thermotogaceae bacterium]|nr:hypothetical protein [Thermotogaceae bacterium]